MLRWCSLVLAGAVVVGQAHGAFTPQGGEYAPVGAWGGDQVFPAVSLNTEGGYIVWHDNATDGAGLGIGARRLDSSLSGSLSTFRVNKTAAGDQERPQVAMLNDGGAVFAWQGGALGAQRIFARFMKPDGTFRGDDIRVSSYTQEYQENPMVAVLGGGDVVAIWSSYGQDGSLLGIYGQRFSATGSKLGGEFQVNQYTALNQRTPALAALADGGFLVIWVSESEAGLRNNLDATGPGFDSSPGGIAFDVHLYARRYAGDGTPLSGEFRVNETANMVCANPVVSVAQDGSLLVAWSGRAAFLPVGSAPAQWDVFGRFLSADASPASGDFMVNTHQAGDQFHPKVASLGTDHFVVWTSLGQDGSREGVYGRSINLIDGNGAEMRINTIRPGQQQMPAVASDGEGRFLVVWAGYVGGGDGFDLAGQRYAAAPGLPAPAAPLVSALSQSRLSVSWPDVAGYDVASYEVHVDAGNEPESVQGNMVSVGGFAAGSTHTFQLAYRLADGRRSPLSEPASGTTWGADENFDGLPDDWQAGHWGTNPAGWPSPASDTDGDGASDLQEFLAGTDPSDAASVLKVQILANPAGIQVVWNTQPGLIYQIQSSPDASEWTAFGTARFAAGETDAVNLDSGASVLFYRIIRLR
jgi:hypothetical protein